MIATIEWQTRSITKSTWSSKGWISVPFSASLGGMGLLPAIIAVSNFLICQTDKNMLFSLAGILPFVSVVYICVFSSLGNLEDKIHHWFAHITVVYVSVWHYSNLHPGEVLHTCYVFSSEKVLPFKSWGHSKAPGNVSAIRISEIQALPWCQWLSFCPRLLLRLQLFQPNAGLQSWGTLHNSLLGFLICCSLMDHCSK